MRKKIKVEKIILLLNALLITVFVLWLIIDFFGIGQSNKDLTTIKQDIEIASKIHPTKILVYGDKIDFDKKIDVEYINKINRYSLKFDDKYSFQLIIINDLNNNLSLSNKEWSIINSAVKRDKRCNFIYLGLKEFSKIKELQIVSDAANFEKSDLSIGLFHYNDVLMTVGGTFTTDDEVSLISKEILHEQVYAIKTSKNK